MSHARAMAAGILLTILAYDVVVEETISDVDFKVWLLMVAAVMLLVIPDAIDQYRHARSGTKHVSPEDTEDHR